MTDQVVFDYSQSRAVLVGTWDYTELEPIPAARNSLERMVGLLTSSLCCWPRGALRVVANQHVPADIPDQITGVFETTTDVALFYYVGHGLQDPDDELCLGLVDSRVSPTRRATTSLRFEDVRRALRHSDARTKIVILDCCFAGLARPDGSLASQLDIAELAGRAGAFTMAASGFYTAWFEREGNTPQTYFTKYLVDIVERGIPDEPAGLKLNPIFKQLSVDLARAGKPPPTRWNSDLADQYVFARNTARGPMVGDTAATRSLTHTQTWVAHQPPRTQLSANEVGGPSKTGGVTRAL